MEEKISMHEEKMKCVCVCVCVWK